MQNLIDVDTLSTLLNDPATVVLDASWYLPAEGRDPEAEYAAAHIPLARRFDFDGKVKDQSSGLPHMLPRAEEFQDAAQALGILQDSRIVVYDGAGVFAAPRAWWMFKAMGHTAVSVLDGGLPAWRAAGKPVESGQVLAGVRAALDPLGVSLLGGHTTVGDELFVALTVMGEASGRLLTLEGARAGDATPSLSLHLAA